MISRFNLGILPKNPCDFAEGSVVRSIHTDRVYHIVKHCWNGMSLLYQPDFRKTENWNACNNQHFIPADYVSPAVQLCYI